MRKFRSTLGWLAAGVGALALAGCGDEGTSSTMPTGGSVSTPATPTASASAYTVKSLVSNVSGAASVTDQDLQHGWGISFAPTGAAWIRAHASNVSTVYDGDGNIKLPSVHIPSGASGAPSGPTGQVGYGGSAFVINKNGVSGAPAFMFAGTGGTIRAGTSA